MAQVRISLREAQGELPPVCLQCGAAADVVVAQRMVWRPRWIVWLLPLGGLPYFWQLVRTTRSVRLKVPFCARHQHHWRWRSLVVVLGFAVVLSIALAGFMMAEIFPEGPMRQSFQAFAGLTSAALVVLWAVVLFVCQRTAIQTHLIDDTEITLDGVAPAFIDALVDLGIAQPSPVKTTGEEIQAIQRVRVRVQPAAPTSEREASWSVRAE